MNEQEVQKSLVREVMMYELLTEKSSTIVQLVQQVQQLSAKVKELERALKAKETE